MAVINGTSSSEILNGTAENDQLTGSTGNDALSGGDGIDTAVYSGTSSDYRFGWSNDRLTVTDINIANGDEGTDSLLDIEQLQFADRTFEVTPGGVSRINTTTDNYQYSPTVTTLSDGGWVIAWTGAGAGDGQGIFYQRYDTSGNPVGVETAVNSTTEQPQAMPSVTALNDGGWLVAWAGIGTNDSYGIFTQRYDATGTPMGTETQVITSTDNEIYPSVTGLTDGGWVASWESNGQLFSQRYDSGNNPTGTKTLISQSCTQHSSSITALPDGGWAVSWCELDQYLFSRAAVQRYEADGQAGGQPQLLGSTMGNAHPSVTTLEDGGWLVAWRGWDAIYAQRYDAANAPTGKLIQLPPIGGEVNAVGLADGGWLITSSIYETSPDSNYADTISTRFDASGKQVAVISSGDRSDLQATPSVIVPLPDGGWLVTWEAVDNSYTGIFSQRYNAQGIAQLFEIKGTDQNDVLSGQSPMALSGGAGDDTYIIETTTAVVREQADEGVDTVFSYLSNYTLTDNVENGRILAAGPAAITGNALDNILYAGSGDNGYGAILNGGAGVDTASFVYSNKAIYARINYPMNMINPAYHSLNDIENLTGSAYNDTLEGDTGNNIIDGGLGADKMAGGDGSDTYYVDNAGDEVNETNPSTGGGTDTVYSYLASYTLGSNIENGLILSAGTANLTGNSLNNIFYAGAGNNLLDGAGGVDTVSYAYASSAISANLAITAAQATGGSGLDTLIAIENLIGSAYNDSLTGNSVNNKLNGGRGDDILNGAAGIDNMIGGDGSDTYFVDNTGDVVSETNADLATGGTDTVNSYLAQYTLGANIENGRVLASGAANMTGNNLNNLVFAGAGNNVLNGGGGNDTLSYLYASSAVTVSLANTAAQATGGSGTDTLSAFENLNGSNYNDSLTGDAGNNKLRGGLGNDALNGGAGADNMVGGDGSDTYYVDHAGDIVSETNATTSTGGTDTVYSYLLNYTLGNNIENGRILSSSSANLTGNGLNNVLYASSGNNLLNGGDGADTASYLYATSAVTVRLSNSGAQSTGGSGSDTLSSIENLAGSNYNDTLTGNAAANILSGGQGNDVLDGAAEADILIGGDGSDTYYVDNAGDVVSETNAVASSGGIDIVCSSLSTYTLGANIENGLIAATGAADLTGNSLNNQLIAGSGNNILNGGDGVDTVSYAFASSAVTVNLALGTAQATGGSGSDTLIAIESLNGSNYNDTLTGSADNNTINGGGGNDRLIGGAGKDTLIGGAGSDTFVFNALSEMGTTSSSWDVINDFIRGTDKIDLSKLDANSATVANDAFTQLIAGNATFTAAGQLRLSNGVLYGNTDGDSDAEFAIQLIGVSSVSLADFIA